MADRLLPHAHTDKLTRKAGLFVAAIAIHNFPEGLASGVGFATGNTGVAIALALGIALQNIPEGMIIIAPLMFSGMKKSKALIISMCTGLFEVAGNVYRLFCRKCVAYNAALQPFLCGGDDDIRNSGRNDTGNAFGGERAYIQLCACCGLYAYAAS